MVDELHSCVTGTWSPTIGDPSIMGWVTVFAYFIALLLSGLVLVLGAANRPAFWYFITFCLIFLAVNKQLDLQSALTAVGRCVAKMQGWYENRKVVQIAFISALFSFSFLLTLALAWNLRGRLKRNWLAFIGFAFLVTFVVVRAAGFHDVDQFIGIELIGVRVNWLMELTGIIMISLNAVFLIRYGPAPSMCKQVRRRIDIDLPYRRNHR